MNAYYMTRYSHLLLVISALVISGASCNKEPDKSNRSTTATTELDLALCVLVEDHAEQMGDEVLKDKTGKVWSRDSEPGLTIEDIVTDHAIVMLDANGRFAISIKVRPDSQDRFQAWTIRNRKKTAGFIVDGTVIHVATLENRMRSSLLIGGFASREEAQKLCDRIRSQ